MVFIIYRLFQDKYTFSEEEIGYSYSLNEACVLAYKQIIKDANDKSPFNSTNYKYYIHQYEEPVKSIDHPQSVYVFNASYNCLNDKKQIIWAP